ncbi:Isochorismatase hydrolase [Ascodesmis nigricans]|uniref:Isochorismatase hydrolase n=1 Tax=Ascodesmis nigricans TaxID=341454 RepID=A0A4S2N8F1_9PEZI|nr:Isochorismatase hydrolase [Ascodesmis nigricans]
MALSFRQLAQIPPSTASPSDSVLLVIDAQNEYATGALTVTNLSVSRPNIESLVKQYRANNGYIAHIVHIVPEGTPVFTPGTPLADEFSELQPPENADNEKEVVVEKKFPGSFAETTLGDFVEKSGKKKVVLVGYMAHVCISTTAREAHQKGLEVVVVEDAIGDRDIPGATGPEVMEMVLKELGDFFATVVKRSEIQ